MKKAGHLPKAHLTVWGCLERVEKVREGGWGAGGKNQVSSSFLRHF